MYPWFRLLRTIHYFIIFCNTVERGKAYAASSFLAGLRLRDLKKNSDSGPGLESRLRGLRTPDGNAIFAAWRSGVVVLKPRKTTHGNTDKAIDTLHTVSKDKSSLYTKCNSARRCASNKRYWTATYKPAHANLMHLNSTTTCVLIHRTKVLCHTWHKKIISETFSPGNHLAWYKRHWT